MAQGTTLAMHTGPVVAVRMGQHGPRTVLLCTGEYEATFHRI